MTLRVAEGQDRPGFNTSQWRGAVLDEDRTINGAALHRADMLPRKGFSPLLHCSGLSDTIEDVAPLLISMPPRETFIQHGTRTRAHAGD